MRPDKATGEPLPVPPAYLLSGSDEWADPYIVSLVTSGLAHWSWIYQEPIRLTTGDHPKGADQIVTEAVEFYNSDRHMPLRLDLEHQHRLDVISDDVKVVVVFANDLRGDIRTVDLMARAAITGKVIYQVRKLEL